MGPFVLEETMYVLEKPLEKICIFVDGNLRYTWDVPYRGELDREAVEGGIGNVVMDQLSMGIFAPFADKEKTEGYYLDYRKQRPVLTVRIMTQEELCELQRSLRECS